MGTEKTKPIPQETRSERDSPKVNCYFVRAAVYPSLLRIRWAAVQSRIVEQSDRSALRHQHSRSPHVFATVKNVRLFFPFAPPETSASRPTACMHGCLCALRACALTPQPRDKRVPARTLCENVHCLFVQVHHMWKINSIVFFLVSVVIRSGKEIERQTHETIAEQPIETDFALCAPLLVFASS